jgi:hypothetical protein
MGKPKVKKHKAKDPVIMMEKSVEFQKTEMENRTTQTDLKNVTDVMRNNGIKF